MSFSQFGVLLPGALRVAFAFRMIPPKRLQGARKYGASSEAASCAAIRVRFWLVGDDSVRLLRLPCSRVASRAGGWLRPLLLFGQAIDDVDSAICRALGSFALPYGIFRRGGSAVRRRLYAGNEFFE